MAAGVPVIATPLGGSKELVTPETGTPCALLKMRTLLLAAITQLAEDAERRKRMGEGVPFAGRATVLCDSKCTVDGRSLFGFVVNMDSDA